MSQPTQNIELRPDLAEKTTEELRPTKERIMGKLSYLAAFMGGCISIGTFAALSAY